MVTAECYLPHHTLPHNTPPPSLVSPLNPLSQPFQHTLSCLPSQHTLPLTLSLNPITPSSTWSQRNITWTVAWTPPHNTHPLLSPLSIPSQHTFSTLTLSLTLSLPLAHGHSGILPRPWPGPHLITHTLSCIPSQSPLNAPSQPAPSLSTLSHLLAHCHSGILPGPWP